MARKHRLHFPGAFYHIMMRGNDKNSIFFSDYDRNQFCILLQQGIQRFGYRIHGFCLMGNHVHLAHQVCGVPVSMIMGPDGQV